MSLPFKFDKRNENNPEKKDGKNVAEIEKDIERYEIEGLARNVCFIDTTGKHLFLNYAYLVSGEFSPDENIIALLFTTHSVLVKGHNLRSLFIELFNHLPKQIRSMDKRYIATGNQGDVFVSEIKITKNSNE